MVWSRKFTCIIDGNWKRIKKRPFFPLTFAVFQDERPLGEDQSLETIPLPVFSRKKTTQGPSGVSTAFATVACLSTSIVSKCVLGLLHGAKKKAF